MSELSDTVTMVISPAEVDGFRELVENYEISLGKLKYEVDTASVTLEYFNSLIEVIQTTQPEVLTMDDYSNLSAYQTQVAKLSTFLYKSEGGIKRCELVLKMMKNLLNQL